MKIILNWLKNILTAIKNFLWPFEALGIEKANKESLLLMTEPLQGIWQRNVIIEGNFTLQDNDKLEGCSVGGMLILDGTNITVESCRVDGDILLKSGTSGCEVTGNAVYGKIVVKGDSCLHNVIEHNSLRDEK